ncbi:MAG: SUKH-4 family immunity protein [Lachnospiraceae bacterium]|nr:SUKH-4 family immunity protein [Lachnospiraceae bacterium]
MKIIEQTLQIVKDNLPPLGTELGCYTFLTPDTVWTGTVESQRPFVVVAEDTWSDDSGLIIIVMADGPVYIAGWNSDDTAKSDYRISLDLSQDSLLNYCATDFSKFMQIMNLYLTALENTHCPDIFDEEGMKKCEETERRLRHQIAQIDPSAIEDVEGLWSTLLEELGSGMI